MKVVIVHGMFTKKDRPHVLDPFVPEFERLGYTVHKDEADYEWWGLLNAYFKSKRHIYEKLKLAFEDADIIVTHSRGARFATRALYEMDFRRDPGRRALVHFSPSLKQKTPIPASVDRQYVFFSSRDWVIWLSGFLPRFGRMGSKGYKGDGPNTNIDESDTIKGHSSWSEGDRAVEYPRRIHNLVQAIKYEHD